MMIQPAALATIPLAAREKLFRWRSILEPLAATKRGRTQAFRQAAADLCISESTLRNKFYDYQRRGVEALIDRSLCGPGAWDTSRDIGLSDQDKQTLRRYCENNQRGNKAAIRLMLQHWREGKLTSDSPINTATGYPMGWSERNLLRYAPTKYELTATRIGRTAAASHRQLVYTTRANLWAGSHYLFDDMWHDHFVNELDRRKAGRPLEFHALDLFSACKFAWGMRVRVEQDGQMEQLKEGDMRFLLAYVLGQYGYSPRGTILVVEHGTAAVADWLEEILFNESRGLITVERSGMQGAAAHAGQYAGRAKGNFRFKAALESLGNLIHNEMAHLPGQTGKDLAHRPEQLHGLLKHNDALLMALAQLPPERAAMLTWPLLTIQQFQVVANEIYARINARTQHDLEGWDMHYLPDLRTQGMRRMSPTEVWNQGRRELIPLAPEAIALVLGLDSAQERTIRKGMIELTDSEISGDILRFNATALTEGEKVQAIINPYRPDLLYTYDAKGRFLAALPRIHSVDRSDIESVHRAMGAAAKVESQLLSGVRARHLKEGRAKVAMHKRNAAILSGRPVTPAEKDRALADQILAEKAEATLAAKISTPTYPHETNPTDIHTTDTLADDDSY